MCIEYKSWSWGSIGAWVDRRDLQEDEKTLGRIRGWAACMPGKQVTMFKLDSITPKCIRDYEELRPFPSAGIQRFSPLTRHNIESALTGLNDPAFNKTGPGSYEIFHRKVHGSRMTTATYI
jgi:hypothetical protein